MNLKKVNESDLDFKTKTWSKWDEYVKKLRNNSGEWYEIEIDSVQANSLRSTLHTRLGAGNYTLRKSRHDTYYVKVKE